MQPITSIKVQLEEAVFEKRHQGRWGFLFRKGFTASQPRETKALRRELRAQLLSFIDSKTSLDPQARPSEGDRLHFTTSFTLKERAFKIHHFFPWQPPVDGYFTPAQPIDVSSKRALLVEERGKPLLLEGAECDLFSCNLLCLLLKGDFIIEHQSRSNALCADYWNHWGNHLQAYRCYREILHPVLRQVVFELIIRHQLPEGSVVVELGGGDGELAYELCALMPDWLNYTLLEYNDTLRHQASARLGSRAKAIPFDLVEDRFFFNNNSVNLIVGSGILTFEVLPPKVKDSDLLKRLYDLLLPGGWLLLTGFAVPLFGKREFAAAGFTVLNCSLPTYDRHLFILQKPLEEFRYESEKACFAHANAAKSC